MDVFYRGQAKTVWLLPGAQLSWDAAEALVPPSKRTAGAQFRARIVELADKGTLRSPDHMRFEGEGCYAVKANCGLRAWGWFQHYEDRAAFLISHVTLKKTDRADPADLKRTLEARKPFQEKKK